MGEKFKKYLLTMLGVLLLLIGGCGFFEENNKKTTAPPPPNSTAPRTESQQQPTASNSGIALASTYNENSWGYSVQYPSGWAVQRSSSEVNLIKNGGNIRISVRCAQVSPQYTLEQIVNATEQNVKAIGRANTNLGGVNAIASMLDLGNTRVYRVYAVRNGMLYGVSYVAPHNEFEQNIAIGQAVIQSFRFMR